MKKSQAVKIWGYIRNDFFPVISNLHCGVLFWVGVNIPTMIERSVGFEAHLAIAPASWWQVFYLGFSLLGYLSLFAARALGKSWLWQEWTILSGVIFFILASVLFAGVGSIFNTAVSTYTLLGVNAWLQALGVAENGNLVEIKRKE